MDIKDRILQESLATIEEEMSLYSIELKKEGNTLSYIDEGNYEMFNVKIIVDAETDNLVFEVTPFEKLEITDDNRTQLIKASKELSNSLSAGEFLYDEEGDVIRFILKVGLNGMPVELDAFTQNLQASVFIYDAVIDSFLEFIDENIETGELTDAGIEALKEMEYDQNIELLK